MGESDHHFNCMEEVRVITITWWVNACENELVEDKEGVKFTNILVHDTSNLFSFYKRKC